jgi:hypothetical protein
MARLVDAPLAASMLALPSAQSSAVFLRLDYTLVSTTIPMEAPFSATVSQTMHIWTF